MIETLIDRNILAKRITKISDEIPKLTNTIFAMELTNTDIHPLNYVELSIDAAIRAERIACSIRNLIYAANIVSKPVLMNKIATAHGITIKQNEEDISITLPGLLPKQSKRTNSKFITEPLHYCLEQYAKEHEMKHFSECVICFSHVYDHELSARRIRDYDNIECKNILDTIASFIMTDDSGTLCNTYHTTKWGEKDCTIVTVMTKKRFPHWILEHESYVKPISTF